MATAHDSDEECVYVVLELEGAPLPVAGAPLQLRGLDSPSPVLELADGTQLVGEFEETLGTQMVFTDDMAAASDGPRTVELLCHTDKKIRFKRRPAPPMMEAQPS